MIVDNYILEKRLGGGNFGEVYLTKKKGDTNRKYATKRYEKDKVDNNGMIEYLKNEIIILQFLKHPNIAKYEEVKKSKKHYYIMMEFCNGGGLSEALENYMEKYNKPFSEEIVQYFMRQIIDAFKYMHERRIIHRDVKLENILLSYENEKDKENFDLMKAQIKIIDFGFACQVTKNGLKYTVLGSPINMDPLILQKRFNQNNKKLRQLGYTQKADIWSIGTICYEMLIGSPVFDAEDEKELIKKVEEGNYTIPTTLSYEVISFLNGMLQYDPSRRLSAEQLSRHDFLTKNVKDFKQINLKKVDKNLIGDDQLNINTKKNTTIWSIFNDNDEEKLTNINGAQFIKPIDEKERIEFQNFKNSFVILPKEGIPGNTEQKISTMTPEEQAKEFGHNACYIF